MAISAISWVGLGQITAAIPKVDAFAGLDDRPKRESSAVNYLIVGSDTREGLTRAEIKKLKVGGTEVAAGKRSDTMLLVHISKSGIRPQLFRFQEIPMPKFLSMRTRKAS